MRRRDLLLQLSASVALAGCGTSNFRTAIDAYRGLRTGQRTYPRDREAIEAIPYATLGVQVGDAPRAIMVLVRNEHGEQHWYAADRVVLVTRDGRLVQTSGLKPDLRGTRFESADPLALLAQGGAASGSLVRRLDLLPDLQFGVEVHSQFARAGSEDVQILEFDYRLDRWTEQVQVPAWGWQAQNEYWVDPADGYVWRSRQSFCPQLPPVTLEILKRPA